MPECRKVFLTEFTHILDFETKKLMLQCEVSPCKSIRRYASLLYNSRTLVRKSGALFDKKCLWCTSYYLYKTIMYSKNAKTPTRYSLYKTIMYSKNAKTPTLEYGRRAPPHHCCDKDGGGKRKMSRGRQKRESSIPSSNTHPSPKSDGPC